MSPISESSQFNGSHYFIHSGKIIGGPMAKPFPHLLNLSAMVSYLPEVLPHAQRFHLEPSFKND